VNVQAPICFPLSIHPLVTCGQLRFSVIIPLYNKAERIESALRSVLDQQHQAFEVIVVDDGSTDDGAQRVAAFTDPRLRLLRQANGGVSTARNRGIRAATGNYVAFLDADDYWTPGYLSAIAEVIGRFPGCGLYATHWYFFDDDGFRKVPRQTGARASTQPQRIDRFFEIWGRAQLFFTSSVVVPIGILRDFDISFPKGEQRGEDQDVWFRIAERWPVAYCSKPLVGYRVGTTGGLMMSYPEDVLPYMKRLRTRYRSHLIPSQHRPGVRRVIGVNQINIARNRLLKGRRGHAIRLLRDPMCLSAPGYWLRVLLATCMPTSLRARLIGREVDRFHA
jgi:glycosyltransferase involved in cell wall biosynthesis